MKIIQTRYHMTIFYLKDYRKYESQFAQWIRLKSTIIQMKKNEGRTNILDERKCNTPKSQLTKLSLWRRDSPIFLTNIIFEFDVNNSSKNPWLRLINNCNIFN